MTLERAIDVSVLPYTTEIRDTVYVDAGERETLTRSDSGISPTRPRVSPLRWMQPASRSG